MVFFYVFGVPFRCRVNILGRTPIATTKLVLKTVGYPFESRWINVIGTDGVETIWVPPEIGPREKIRTIIREPKSKINIYVG